MPAEVILNDRTLELSPEFAYKHTRGNPVQFVARGEATEEAGVLKEGEVLNRDVPVMASAAGGATLVQIGHDEIAKLNLPAFQATRANELHPDSPLDDTASQDPKPAKPSKDDDADTAPSVADEVDNNTEPNRKSSSSSKSSSSKSSSKSSSSKK